VKDLRQKVENVLTLKPKASRPESRVDYSVEELVKG